MATNQQMREGEAELARIARWVARQTSRPGREAELDPRVANIRRAAADQARMIRINQGRSAPGMTPAVRQQTRVALDRLGTDHVNNAVAQVRPILSQLSPRNVDSVLQGLAVVEGAVGHPIESLRQLARDTSGVGNLPGTGRTVRP